MERFKFRCDTCQSTDQNGCRECTKAERVNKLTEQEWKQECEPSWEDSEWEDECELY